MDKKKEEEDEMDAGARLMCTTQFNKKYKNINKTFPDNDSDYYEENCERL